MYNKPGKKIFVIDTSVILFDHTSIYHFDEHDIVIPIVVLEELDNFKQGNSDKNYQTRAFIRIIDKLSNGATMQNWIPLDASRKKGSFKVFMYSKNPTPDANVVFGEKRNDHKILNTALSLMNEFPKREIVLVSKDINLRLKAKSLQIKSEDYNTGKVKDIKSLHSSVQTILNVPRQKMVELYEPINFTSKGEGVGLKEMKVPKTNAKFLILKGAGKKSCIGYIDQKLEKVFPIKKKAVYKIEPLNGAQLFAIQALLDSRYSLVTLQGIAGTGKTLLALASALEQKEHFRQIYLARPIVPLSNKDIGYLPGDMKSKVNPYMEPLWDNLKFIKDKFLDDPKEQKKIQDMVDNEKLLITPLAYIRGRSISNAFFIVDEAQNLTPHEVKTIVTRAGQNTKIVFTGDIRQIDTPYLDSESNGLSYLISKTQNHPVCAHITLEKGERSELANLANDLL